MKHFIAITYIIKEILPSLLVGSIVFISILLTFQILKLTEFVLIHGIQIQVIFQLVFYLSISFLPMILPMSVLFSILMTYGRLSSESEIIAFKSLGLSQRTLTIPALVVGIFMTFLSAETFFRIGPWGQRQFTDLFQNLGSAQVISTIREGTFAEGFYDLVVYANKVNQKKGILYDVFIYDERSESNPLTIIAKEGQILNLTENVQKASVLRLFQGSIHRVDQEAYTKVQFENYDIFLTSKFQARNTEKEPKAMTLSDLNNELDKPNLEEKKKVQLLTEYHKRWALPFACLIFSVIGVGFGTVTNKRAAKSSGFIFSVSLIVIYWVSTLTFDNFANQNIIPAYLAMWITNFVFALIGFFSLKAIWNK